MFGGRIGPMELLIILAIVLIVFGGKKIPELMRGMGEGIRSFREGMKEEPKPSDHPAEQKKP